MESFFTSIGPALITALASVLVFGSVIFVHELGHFLSAKFSKITVHEFAIGMGPAILKYRKNGTLYALRLVPIGGFVSMEGEDEESDSQGSFSRAPIKNRILVIVSGAIMNLILGFILVTIIISSSQAITSTTIAEFYDGATTQASGLMVNDEIVAVNGRRCFTTYDISYEFARAQNGTADLTVVRNGERIELEGVMFDTFTDEYGNNSFVIDFKVYGIQKTFFSVVTASFEFMASLIRMVVISLVDLVTGRIAINNISGPVGIVTAIGQASGAGLGSLLMLTALITVNLGVFNLVPFPALDGGRLVFLLLEAIRRKPINQKYEIAINAAGFMLLIGLMLFATFNDVTRIFT